jgi:bile acid-coenzyme A ligase
MITIPGVLASLAASDRTADKPALLGNDPVTFAELYERATARVAELADLGVTGGSILAVICFNETYLFEYLVAAGHLGAAIMPLSPALTDREVHALVDKADAMVCLVSPQLDAGRLGALQESTGRPCRAVMPAVLSGAVRDLALPRADSTCWVSTTGGSTGTPRLFAVSHERLLTNSVLNAFEWGWSRYALHLAVSPIAHGIGFSHAVGQLATGGTVVLVERYSPAAAAGWLFERSSVWTAVVPTVIHDLQAYSEEVDRPLSGLDLVVTAGAPLTARLRDRVLAAQPGRRLVEYYGSTELGWVTWVEHKQGDPRNGVVGAPMLGTKVRIVDGDGRPLPTGEVGRIEKFGRPYAIPLGGGAAAYEANATSWESSGDLGRIDSDGLLIMAGRADDMLVVGGQNVYPVEVEGVIREHPLVREVVVRGEESPRLGQRLVAVVELGSAPPEDFADQLSDFMAERLSKYKRPAAIVVVDALPRNTAGKISRSFALSDHG